jgi:Zn-finger nucleic acid-binding protein
MQERTKTGVLIDVCPTCKGVWLDRGELDKILIRAREVEREWAEEHQRLEPQRKSYDDEDYEDRRYTSPGRYHKKRRWTEIFDIFD